MKMISGNQVFLLTDEVIKFGTDVNGLRVSAQLQQEFDQTVLRTPEIYYSGPGTSAGGGGPQHFIRMQRVRGRSVWQSPGPSFEPILFHLERQLSSLLEPLGPVLWNSMVYDKLDQIVHRLPERLVEHSIVTDTLQHLQRVMGLPEAQIPIPYGPPHGDFTTVNMVYAGAASVYVFDFLPTYLQSPVLDLSKLMQDVHYGWMNHVREPGALEVPSSLMTATEGEVWRRFPHWKFLTQQLFTRIDLLRILPYAVRRGSTDTENWILQSLALSL